MRIPIAALALVVAAGVWARAADSGPEPDEAAAVVYDGEELFVIRAGGRGQTPGQRARVVSAVLERLDRETLEPGDLRVESGAEASELFVADRMLISVGATDAEADGVGVEALARTWRNRIAAALFGPASLLPTDDPYRFLEAAAEYGVPVILSFYSRACYWCRVIRGEYKSLMEDYGDRVGLLYININDPYNDELVFAFDAFAVPWNVFIDGEGEFFGIYPGYGSRSELERAIKPLLTDDRQ